MAVGKSDSCHGLILIFRQTQQTAILVISFVCFIRKNKDEQHTGYLT